MRILAANWKMHHGVEDTVRFFEAFRRHYRPLPGIATWVAPPFISIPKALEVRPQGVRIGAQNVHEEEKGAFTGEVSLPMLVELGVEFVIVGHSERRRLFCETDERIRKKLQRTLPVLPTILCVGETLEERRAGQAKAVVLSQVDAALEGIPQEHLSHLVIAYEPVWAIGTGVPATPEDARTMHRAIREHLLSRFGVEIPVLYGGSVKPQNAGDFARVPEVAGALIGGASLEAESFWAIHEVFHHAGV